MWVKVPTAAVSVVCSAGLVAALALPVAMQEAPEVAKNLGVKLSVNWGNLDAFNAIPSYEALLGGDLSALNDLATTDGISGILALLNGDPSQLVLTDGIPAYVEYLQTGNLEAFRTTDDHRGADLLNALPLYEDLFSSDQTVRDDAFGALDSVSAVPAYEQIASGDVIGGLGGFDATNAIPVYAAALNGNPAALTGLATLDGVPALAGALGGDLRALRPAADGSGGYAALSAIPEYLGLSETPPPPAPVALDAGARVAVQNEAPKTPVANLVNQVVGSLESALPGAGKQSATEGAGEDITPAVVTDNGDGKTAKVSDVRDRGDGNLGKFTPKVFGDSPILFGSNNSGQEGMRGYGKFLKKLGIGGGDSGEGSAAGDGSGGE